MQNAYPMQRLKTPPTEVLNFFIEQNNDLLVTIDLIGSITGEARDMLVKVYNQIEAIAVKNVIFNLTDCQHMYSPGIAVLLDIIIKTGKICDKLCLVVPNNHYRKLFHIMGFEPFVVICASPEEAHDHMAVLN